MKNPQAIAVSKGYRKYINSLKFAISELERVEYITPDAADALDIIVGDVSDATTEFLKIIGEYQRA